MKKYLSILAVAAMASSAYSQGLVGFSNGTGLVKQWTDNANNTLISVPKNGGFVQLYWAAAGAAYTPWTTSMSAAQFYAANPAWVLQNPNSPTGFLTPSAGKFSGGQQTLQPLGAGGNIDYVVVGWTGSAATFDAAITGGAMVGVSGKFSSGTGNPLTTPAGTPTPIAASFGGMTLEPLQTIPEPSTFALAGLGAAAMVIFRRRK